ncbi:MAG: hypothetical protein K8R10_08965, partial [Rhodocyclales bacterium]|nr:hypothetical protein [Rhodocyclales bacterium]
AARDLKVGAGDTATQTIKRRIENGAMKIAPFGETFAARKGVFLQLQRIGDRRCAASSRSVQ